MSVRTKAIDTSTALLVLAFACSDSSPSPRETIDASQWAVDAATQARDAHVDQADASHDAGVQLHDDGGRIEDAGAYSLTCPGVAPVTSPTGRSCRTDDDCDGAELCAVNGSYYGCGGACQPPMQGCTDGSCPADQVCLSMHVECACTALPPTSCQPRCTTSSCAADEECGADGKCAARACTRGYTCADRTLCAPDRIGADAHGCAVANCSADDVPCPDGFRCEPTISAPNADGCVAIQCTEGWPCAPNRVCGANAADAHGCAPKACQQDTDCGCGPCISGTCHDQLLVCVPPPPP